MKHQLSPGIFYILLDGKEHDEQEIIHRLEHLVEPEFAVRMRAQRHKKHLEHQRKRNKTDKINPEKRREPLTPETCNVEECVGRLIKTSLVGMKNENFIELTESGWKLTEEGKQACRTKQRAGKIGNFIKLNLMLRNELI